VKQLHEGLDYKLYQIYAWGGLFLLVIYIVVTALILESRNQLGSAGGPLIIIPMMLWFGGILLYWWWVFLFKGNKELQELAQSPIKGFPGIDSLKNWNKLHQAMAVHGGDVKEFIKNAKRANRPMIVWFGLVNLLPCWIFGPFVLGFLGLMPVAAPDTQLRIWVGGAVVWAVLMLVLTYVLLGWGGRAAEKAYLAPLGLTVTTMPGLTPDVIGMIGGGQKLIPDGPAIVEGERYGRLVHIETIDKYSLTVLEAKLPEFKVQSKEGKLIPDKNAPGEVLDALKSLRKAKRWQGIEVYAGPDGIAIQRESKGTNMWLYDLWLAEYLLDKISTGQS